MEKWVCSHCGHIYSPAAGGPDHTITRESAIFQTLRCPKCGAAQKMLECFNVFRIVNQQ